MEVSLLEAGQAFIWPSGMKENTFFDTETRRSIGGPRFEHDLIPVGSGEWVDPLCGAPVRKIAEVHEDPQTRHNGNILERPLYDGGRVTVLEPKAAARFMRTPTEDPGLAPCLGEHNEAVLKSLGYTVEQIAELGQRGAFGRHHLEKLLRSRL